MNFETIKTSVIILILTLISGWGDSRGFLYASEVWKDGQFVPEALLKSGLGFLIGTSFYWIVIKFLQEVGIVSPELQTLGWFAVIIIGLSISSGKFFQWERVDQIVAFLVIGGVGWLLFRTGG